MDDTQHVKNWIKEQKQQKEPHTFNDYMYSAIISFCVALIVSFWVFSDQSETFITLAFLSTLLLTFVLLIAALDFWKGNRMLERLEQPIAHIHYVIAAIAGVTTKLFFFSELRSIITEIGLQDVASQTAFMISLFLGLSACYLDLILFTARNLFRAYINR